MTNTPMGWLALMSLMITLGLGTAGCPGEESDDDTVADDDDATADDDDATADDDDATPGDDDDATPGDDDDATPGDDDDATPGDDDDATPGDDDDATPGDDDDSVGDDDDATPGDDDDATADDDDSVGDDDDATPGDDDDATADDDDTVGDDDDSVGDDDDSLGDDDDTVSPFDMTGQVVSEENAPYVHRQSLQGMHSATVCPDCEFVFDIEFNTLGQSGTCAVCWDLADGTYTMGVDMAHDLGGYGYAVPAIVYDYGGTFYFWYYAEPGYGGHTLGLYYYFEYYGYTFTQQGYWDFDVPDADGDGHDALTDCDDNDPAIHPGATELCNGGVDDDCDPTTNDAEDLDGDGFAAVCDGDCDDADPAINPGAVEVCDGADTDCDGSVPANEADVDGDGAMICDGDCDDSDAGRFPGNPEVCDGGDNDCDPSTNEAADVDADGFSICAGDCDDFDAGVNPGATEVCDGVDNNCDGNIDEIGCNTMTGMALTIENSPYMRRQELSGTSSASPCPGCEYTFDITYTTVLQNGTSLWGLDLDDGQYSLGYDGDYLYGGNTYELIFMDYYGSWYLWYMAAAGYNGHDIGFSWYDYYGSYTVSQYGYWDF